MSYTHPVCGWLFPSRDEPEEKLDFVEMAVALAEMEAPFPSDEFDDSVTFYSGLSDHDLLDLYLQRAAV